MQIQNIVPIILTYNDELMIGRLLDDLKPFGRVMVIDSFSNDRTKDIVAGYGRDFIQHKFVNQATQINWAVDTFLTEDQWVLRLDSDERVSGELIQEIQKLCRRKTEFVGYINRRMYWMGRKLNFSGVRTHYIGRLYQPTNARYEEVTEEHLQHACASYFLKASFYEENLKNNIDYFILKHLETAKGEVNEYLKLSNVARGKLISRHAHIRRRWLKLKVYNTAPLFSRPVLYFIYRYIFQLGFLDGKAGFSFCFFQALFYRMLIDQIISETENGKNND